jgi:hypothetical protein
MIRRLRPRPFHAALTLTLLAAGCSATGGGTGLVTDRVGRPMGAARVAYETDGGATAKLTVVTPDGETYSGSAVSLQTATDPHVGFLLGKGKDQSSLLVDAGNTQWSGTIAAVLFGSSGRTMQCRLHEKRPGLGLEGGAIGTCHTSDDREIVIDV